MNGSLIDTNVIVKILRGDTEALAFLDNLADDIYISVIVIGELLYGANKSVKTEQNKNAIREKIELFEILPIDAETAEEYGKIKIELATAGYTLPENDLWIAATARRHGLSLVTFDNHFQHVGNLSVIGI